MILRFYCRDWQNKLGKAVRDREMMPHFYPMTRMTKTKEDGKQQGVPNGYEEVHLSLAEEEWQSVASGRSILRSISTPQHMKLDSRSSTLRAPQKRKCESTDI